MDNPDNDTQLDTLAAIDLGSNSFHMVIARVVDGELQVVDRIKDMVRLAAGLGPDKRLDPDSRERALDALRIFGERLRGMPQGSVRAVGTNTLRKAHESRHFLYQAEKALGHPIEVISGSEEARLVYLGVSHTVGAAEHNRLVMDIGGGSTEFIIGRGFEPLVRESKYMGCVSYSKRHFHEGVITRSIFDKAVISARRELENSERQFIEMGWNSAVGSSGTIKAIHDIIVENGLEKSGITYSALKQLRNMVVDVGRIDQLQSIPGMPTNRAAVFAGGLAILLGSFKSLGIEHMVVSDGALREGVLYDLLGRLSDSDIRQHTIWHLAEHNQVDAEHAERVGRTAQALLQQVAEPWGLQAPEFARVLSWSSCIHEIGLSISHSRYHIHGSYLVENSDLPGFSREEQKVLWAMVRSHRRRFKLHRFEDLHAPYHKKGAQLAMVLRLAALLNRSRRDNAFPLPVVKVKSDTKIRLRFPDGWLDNNPLTRAGLEREADYVSSAFSLKAK